METTEEIMLVPINESNMDSSQTYYTRNSDDCYPTNLEKTDLDSINNSESSEEDVPKKVTKKRVKKFYDSDTKENNSNIGFEVDSKKSVLRNMSDSDSDTVIFKSIPHKSRILLLQNGDSSDSDRIGSDTVNKNEEQQLRMKNKRNKLKNKFKNLISSREKDLSLNASDTASSDASGDEAMSINTIKKKIKEKISFKPSICDPDTSDEENSLKNPTLFYKEKKQLKRAKVTSPKPQMQKMSVKQAMENMKKIKSESNRMLREKDVSLPYHRPKALTLKDIMNRRKPALSSDGKALPIKMNEDQLKQYAHQLEERQREIMELCKSESEDDVEVNNKETYDTLENDSENVPYVQLSTDRMDNYKRNSLEILPNVVNLEKESIHSDTECERLTEFPNPIENYTTKKLSQKSNEATNNQILSDELNATYKKTDSSIEGQDCEASMTLCYNDSAVKLIKTVTDHQLIDVVKDVTKAALEFESCNSKDIGIGEKQAAKCANNLDENTRITSDQRVNLIREEESQLISLHFEPEKSDNIIMLDNTEITLGLNNIKKDALKVSSVSDISVEDDTHHNSKYNDDFTEIDQIFLDDDINMKEIDKIIESAEIIRDIEDKINTPLLIRDKPLTSNPKLTGGPGMVIDLDNSGSVAPKKSGVELLKERFIFFSKLKTPEEVEKEKENRLKPGTQLKKLKEVLGDEIAEKRSLEWAKRLEEDKQQQKEHRVLRGEESDDNSIDKIEAEIEEEEKYSEESENEDDEIIENDVVIKDKPRLKNAMIADEAEESDYEQSDDNDEKTEIPKRNDEAMEASDGNVEEEEDEENESESDELSESEDEQQSTTKKGRILKAFEDSDDEENTILNVKPDVNEHLLKPKDMKVINESSVSNSVLESAGSQATSQDEELQLAQRHETASEDLFTSQESTLVSSEAKSKSKDIEETDENFTQTFSILDSSKQANGGLNLESNDDVDLLDTQSHSNDELDPIPVMCPVTLSQNILPSQIPTTLTMQTQAIGEDLLALCTGQFYDNQFVSQSNLDTAGDSQKYYSLDEFDKSQSQGVNTVPQKEPIVNTIAQTDIDFIEITTKDENRENKGDPKKVDDNLKSILDELNDPEFDSPKPNKFFIGAKKPQKIGKNEMQIKKKLVIDSDDETMDVEMKDRTKKLKKKKPEKRALQISDDEDDEQSYEDMEEYESDIEEDAERIVEYDSEENEIQVKPQKSKKKRKGTDFLENEAELTSEDEWVGSGDEDEAGLDRMEREEGDDDIFHQGQLQRELGQIHMRDVLDQDKREVRMIQELLFEDGDLGGGGRQRKFRWNNIDGEEELGTNVGDMPETQEEEFESEEQWRKQRHEREMFLRQMHNKDDPEDSLNVSVNRTTIIKANLNSKTMSCLLQQVNSSKTTIVETTPVVAEKKSAKDIPSPKKSFALLQQSFQGSLLSRGRGALARLAALATPLATDDDTRLASIGNNNGRNFVFAALTPEQIEPKVTKRKAESNPTTPKLVKKMRTEEKKISKSSLLDHLRV